MMFFKKYPQARSFLIILTIIPLYISSGISAINGYSSKDDYFSINQSTSTSSPSATDLGTSTQTQSGTSTNTLVPGTAITETSTPSSVNTVQPSLSPTSLSGTTTNTPELSKTSTPNITNTPGPTETFIPLPSITLLFPIDTATQTPEGLSIEKLLSPSPPAEISQDIPGRISARSILLFGTILILWVILAFFIFFYIKRLAE
jgi:hypothetical protein